MSYRLPALVLLSLFILTPTLTNANPSPDTIEYNIGFFEAGLAHQHEILRREFVRQLRAIAPDSVSIVTIARGYRQANWFRDSSRIMAAQLAAEPNIDLMVALGPWTVEDLIETGYPGPILALYRIDPMMEELLDSTGRPRWPNLTVHYQPNRIRNDLSVMAEILSPKKVGLLYFPSGGEAPYVFTRLEAVANQLGMELVTANETNNFGTFAFYKSYATMRDKVDAVYLGPLWGLPSPKTKDFLTMLNREGMPSFCYDGPVAVIRGAILANTGVSSASVARYQAQKAWQILQGATPADLPVTFDASTGLTLNEEAARLCKIRLPRWIRSQAIVLAPAQNPDATDYTLTQAIWRALDQHPSIHARRDAFTAAREQINRAWSEYYPQIGLELQYRHNDDNRVANTESEIDQDQTRATLSLSQTLLSMETIRSARVAEQESRQAEIDLDRTALDLELAVTLAYLDYLSASRRYDIENGIAQQVLRNQELAGARDRIESDDWVDYFRWEQEYQQAAAAVHRAEAEMDAARATFNSLMNMPPEQEIKLDPAPFGQAHFYTDYQRLTAITDIPLRWQQLQGHLVQAARTLSPEMRTYKNRIRLGQRLLDRNRARFLPVLSAEGALYRADELADRPGIFEEKHNAWYLGAALRLPLFSGGSRFKERARLKAEISRDEWQRDAYALKIAGEVSSLSTRMASVGRNLAHFLEAEKLADITVDMALVDYEAGRSTYLHALDAIDNLRESQLATLDNWREYYARLASLVRLIGWSSRNANMTFNALFYNETGKFLKGDTEPANETP